MTERNAEGKKLIALDADAEKARFEDLVDMLDMINGTSPYEREPSDCPAEPD